MSNATQPLTTAQLRTWTRRLNDALEFASNIDAELAAEGPARASEAGRIMQSARIADMQERAASWRAEAAKWQAKLDAAVAL